MTSPSILDCLSVQNQRVLKEDQVPRDRFNKSSFEPSKGGRTELSEIPVKDVVIVIFMLLLWLYSIMLIVRAWAKIHNLPGNSSFRVRWNGGRSKISLHNIALYECK